MSKGKTTTIGIDASRANRPGRTGVEWYAFHLIQRLKTIIPSEVRVVLYTEVPLRDGLEVLPPNWENRVLRWLPGRLWTQSRLSWEMLTNPPDLLFVPSYVPPVITPKRTLTTVHDVAFVPFPSGYTTLSRPFLIVMTHIAVHAGRLLTVSEFSKKDIVKYFPAKPSQIDVTPLGYDEARYHLASEQEIAACLSKYGIAKPYFLFVGRLETKKNLRRILEAFRAYRAARPAEDAKLVLVGKPGCGYDLDMQAMGEDIRPHVIQPGYVASEDMAALYSGATAFLFVSHYEGFGIPLLEAFACGTPVIASDSTSLPEIAGDAALFVSATDTEAIVKAMTTLASDATLRESLRQKGFARLKQFSWQITAEKTWAVMRKMLIGEAMK